MAETETPNTSNAEDKDAKKPAARSAGRSRKRAAENESDDAEDTKTLKLPPAKRRAVANNAYVEIPTNNKGKGKAKVTPLLSLHELKAH